MSKQLPDSKPRSIQNYSSILLGLINSCRISIVLGFLALFFTYTSQWLAYGLPFLRVEVVWYFAYFCKGAIGIPSFVRGSRQMDHIVWTCLLSVKTEEILRGHAQMPQVSWNNDDSNMVPYIPTSASLLVGIHCIDHELSVFPKNVLGAFIFTNWALRFITLWLWLT